MIPGNSPDTAGDGFRFVSRSIFLFSCGLLIYATAFIRQLPDLISGHVVFAILSLALTGPGLENHYTNQTAERTQ